MPIYSGSGIHGVSSRANPYPFSCSKPPQGFVEEAEGVEFSSKQRRALDVRDMSVP